MHSPCYEALNREGNNSLNTIRKGGYLDRVASSFYYEDGQNSLFSFICMMAVVVLVFDFIGNNFVRLYCDNCHISVHLKKNIKIGEFLCSDFNIEDGRRYATFFGILSFMISRKVKMQLK